MPNTGDPTPVDIWTGKGLPNGYVSCIAVDKTNSNKALAVFSNYNILSLFYTSDGGSTWTSVGGNLEENTNGTGDGPSTRWASILNFNGQTIYLVATSTGLASTTNLNGSSIVWANEAATTIGNVVCVMVLSRDSDGYIAVGTHGNGVFTALTTVTGIDVVSNNIPNSFALSQNYPNPFNPSTKIQFSIPEATNVNLTIYDQLGKKVKELLNKNFSAGKYSVDFNANNLSSGVYYYRIIAGNFVQSNKMILLK
ncbi:MAG: T9SS type A sorting domain-containing protein [Bacteroidetes bacterium]|nr:T9SS type A sorting domain-containing protein [Bacteroidota bacterium]